MLVRAGLVQQAGEQFALHDLIRLFASEQVGEEGPPALRRLLSFYTVTTSHAAVLAFAAVRRLDPLPLDVEGRVFATADEARGWFDAKRAALVTAVQVAPHPFASHIADSMRGYLVYGGYRTDSSAVLTAGLLTARAAGDAECETAMLNGLGQLHWLLGEYDEALKAYGAAAQPATSDLMKGALFNNMGLVRRDLGDLAGALADMQEARRLSADEPTLLVTLLINLGTVHGARAELRKAIEHLDEARRLSEEQGFTVKSAIADENIGVAHRELGEFDQAPGGSRPRWAGTGSSTCTRTIRTCWPTWPGWPRRPVTTSGRECWGGEAWKPPGRSMTSGSRSKRWSSWKTSTRPWSWRTGSTTRWDGTRRS